MEINSGLRFLAALTAFQRFCFGPDAMALTLLTLPLVKNPLISLFQTSISARRCIQVITFSNFNSLFLLLILHLTNAGVLLAVGLRPMGMYKRGATMLVAVISEYSSEFYWACRFRLF